MRRLQVLAFAISGLIVGSAGFAAAPVGALGLGLYVEGMRRLRSPDPETEPVPLFRAGLILVAIGFVWVVPFALVLLALSLPPFVTDLQRLRLP